MSKNESPTGSALEAAAQQMDAARMELVFSVKTLERGVKQATDWRALYRRRPELFLLGGFALGVYIGLKFSDRS